MIYFFWASFLCFLLGWILYPASIIILSRRRSVTRPEMRNPKPVISIIVAAYNEEGEIINRINNLRKLTGGYSSEILIGSDGSTDNTARVARSVNYPEVKVLQFEKNRGRALVHNDCAEAAQGKVLLFSDAETIFEEDFLEQIIPHFENPIVGAVSGRIIYVNEDKTSIGRSAGLYWKYEELIRVSESRLGILGFGSGAALAIRKDAYTAISPSEDIDYATTLEVAARGYKVLYEPKALAYDYISETAIGAFKTRVRQTSRCFKSVLRRIIRPSIMIKKPFVFISALMHKTFRHLTPYFLICLFISNLFIFDYNIFYTLFFIIQLIFYILSAVGFICSIFSLKSLNRIASLPYNFMLLNISRAVGVIQAIIGKEKATYKTDL